MYTAHICQNCTAVTDTSQDKQSLYTLSLQIQSNSNHLMLRYIHENKKLRANLRVQRVRMHNVWPAIVNLNWPRCT